MKRWLGVTVLALASLAAMGPLVDNYDLSSYWHLHLNRDGAIAAARALAAKHGVDARDWEVLCRTRLELARVYLERMQQRPVHPLFTPVQYDVLLTQPGGRRWVRLALTADGDPVSFQQAAAPGRQLPKGHAPAAELLELYARHFRPSFQPENEGVEQGGARIDSWLSAGPSQFDPSARFEVVDDRGALRSAKLELRLPAEFLQRYRRNSERQNTLMATLGMVTVAIAFAVAFPLFFRGLVRRQFPSRLLLPVYVFFLTLALVSLWTTTRYTQAFSAAETFSSLTVLLQPVVLGYLLLAATPTLYYGAGRASASDADLMRWFSFEALVTRRWWLRPVGLALVGGVLSGCVLAVVPFVSVLLGPIAAPNLVDVSLAMLPHPALGPFAGLSFPDAALLLFLLWPLRNRLKRAWVGWLLYGLAGAILVAFLRDLYSFWAGHQMVAALFLALGYLAIYQVFDLLAALVASLVMSAVTLAVALSFQPAGLRMDALEVMTVPLVLLTLGGLLAWRGRTVDIAGEVARQRAELKETGSDRDRLRAEFSVARKAQLGMLPNVPVSVDGTSLAASCHPAREVGGDLYDFFRCADGRYGICVADVSGKGVSASLYMALTKGVMAAANVEGAAIPELLATLNRHLLEFGKRRMFVTMALGYYDATTRVLEHARAGHNPILVWRAARGAGEFLKPGGVGLGLASPRSFERTLRLDRVELAPGDLVVFYSDGIVEAMNLELEQFGEERLMEAVQHSADLSAQAVEAEISRRVRSFAGAAPVHDDQTLFVLRVG